METKSICRRSVTNVRPYSVSSFEIELCLRTDSARPLARSYCLAIRALGEPPCFQPLCVPVGMEFVAALMAALHQIEDDPSTKAWSRYLIRWFWRVNRRSTLSETERPRVLFFPCSMIWKSLLTRWSLQLLQIGKVRIARTQSPGQPEAQALGRHCPKSVLNAANRVCLNRHFSYVKENPEPTGL